MKKSGFNPFILLTQTGDEGGISGGASGLGGDKIAIPYSEWPTSGYQWGYDNYPQDDTYSWYEYYLWWVDQSFPDSQTLWDQTNPGVPYGGPYPDGSGPQP